MSTQLELLQKQQDAFDEQLHSMLQEHEGEFVLFGGGEPCGFFETYNEAYAAGLESFGVDGVFIVDEVRQREPCVTSLSWESGVMFAGR